MLAALDATEHQIAGPRGLLFDEAATRSGIDSLNAAMSAGILLFEAVRQRSIAG